MAGNTSHIVSPKLYVGIWIFLLCMTGLTVYAASIELHAWNPVVALVIATMKALAVILFFMHVKYSPRITQVIIVAAIFWLVLLLGLTLTDYITRIFVTYPSS